MLQKYRQHRIFATVTLQLPVTPVLIVTLDIQMKKLILSAAIGIGTVLGINAADKETFTYEGLIYNVLSRADKTCEVGRHDYKDTSFAKGSVVIPPKAIYEGEEYTVTALGDSAFYGNGQMTALSIPETVTTIKKCAISQTLMLFELRIPDSVTEVESRGVYGNRSIGTLVLSSNLREINREAFNGNSGLTAIVIPDAVETIHDDAFNYCARVTRIIFGSGVTTIGKMAFAGLGALQRVSIPANIRQIGDEAFSYCERLATVTFEESTQPLALGTNVFGHGIYATNPNNDAWCRLKTLTLDRPWTCTSTTVTDLPFSTRSTLQTINIGPNVKSIPANSFAGCDNVTAVNITGTVTPSVSSSSFTQSAFSNATLTVPESMLPTYKAHSVWGRFSKIVGASESGITDIEADPTNRVVEYYDLSGRRIDNPDAQGIYIVRRADGSTGKILIR